MNHTTLYSCYPRIKYLTLSIFHRKLTTHVHDEVCINNNKHNDCHSQLLNIWNVNTSYTSTSYEFVIRNLLYGICMQLLSWPKFCWYCMAQNFGGKKTFLKWRFFTHSRKNSSMKLPWNHFQHFIEVSCRIQCTSDSSVRETMLLGR